MQSTSNATNFRLFLVSVHEKIQYANDITTSNKNCGNDIFQKTALKFYEVKWYDVFLFFLAYENLKLLRKITEVPSVFPLHMVILCIPFVSFLYLYFKKHNKTILNSVDPVTIKLYHSRVNWVKVSFKILLIAFIHNE